MCVGFLKCHFWDCLSTLKDKIHLFIKNEYILHCNKCGHVSCFCSKSHKTMLASQIKFNIFLLK